MTVEPSQGKPYESRSWLQRLTYDLTQLIVCAVGRPLFGLRYRIDSSFPQTGGAVVCCNHQSYLDPVLVGSVCRRRMHYLARDTLFKSKWFGGLIRWYAAIPVQRDGLGIGGFKETLRRLKRGEVVLVFPEGTRSSDGELGELKSGILNLARRAQVPLVPAAIEGAFEAWPRGRKFPRPATIGVTTGVPISVQVIQETSDDDLLATLVQRIETCRAEAAMLHHASQTRRWLPFLRQPSR